ncbi:hypothetical protein ACTS9T_15845 [Empedobacter falsenii]|uniref:hypothetical protein n=1 Tax=Empedobacter falsenii TaxID=343874 RepID=UPI00056E3775|nr:hypothetical protein [Empedobacter falsenii]HAR72314.1 hypothetical protein [Flavobacteriaceae bacterium]
MKKKNHINLLVLILSITLFFVIGVLFDLDYRILTRKSIEYLSVFKIGYYGGKEFWILSTNVALILTLIPISFFVLSRKLAKLKLAIFYVISIVCFYCFYCYLESEFIRITVTNPTYDNGALMYHSNNINYNKILIATIISTFVSGIVVGKLTKKDCL